MSARGSSRRCSVASECFVQGQHSPDDFYQTEHNRTTWERRCSFDMLAAEQVHKILPNTLYAGREMNKQEVRIDTGVLETPKAAAQ